MQRALGFLQRWRVLLVACAWLCSLSVARLAMAQEAEEAAENTRAEESWVLSYAFVIVAIFLGLFLMCRPTFRKRDLGGE